MIDDARLRHDGTLEKLTIYLNPFTSTHFIAGKRFPTFSLGSCVFAWTMSVSHSSMPCSSLRKPRLCRPRWQARTCAIATLQHSTCACPCLLNIPTAANRHTHFHFSPAAECKQTTGPWDYIMPATKIWFENEEVDSNKLKQIHIHTYIHTRGNCFLHCILHFPPVFTWNNFFLQFTFACSTMTRIL